MKSNNNFNPLEWVKQENAPQKSTVNNPNPAAAHGDWAPTDDYAQAREVVNRIIQADLPVTSRYVTRDEVPNSIDLSKLPTDASETLRLVYIGDYDMCPCLGAHVERTSEIGSFRISSTSYNDGNFRIVFRVAAQ